jgi:hypothetical protein
MFLFMPATHVRVNAVASIIQTERLPDRFGDLDKDAMRMDYAEFTAVPIML